MRRESRWTISPALPDCPGQPAPARGPAATSRSSAAPPNPPCMPVHKNTAHERAKCCNISCTPATTKRHYPELRWCYRSCHSSPCACDITLHKSRANGNAANVTFSAILQPAQMHTLGTRQTSLPAGLQFASLVKQAGPVQRTRSGLMAVLR